MTACCLIYFLLVFSTLTNANLKWCGGQIPQPIFRPKPGSEASTVKGGSSYKMIKESIFQAVHVYITKKTIWVICCFFKYIFCYAKIKICHFVANAWLIGWVVFTNDQKFNSFKQIHVHITKRNLFESFLFLPLYDL